MTNKNTAQNEVINVKEELKNEQCPKSEDELFYARGKKVGMKNGSLQKL